MRSKADLPEMSAKTPMVLRSTKIHFGRTLDNGSASSGAANNASFAAELESMTSVLPESSRIHQRDGKAKAKVEHIEEAARTEAYDRPPCLSLGLAVAMPPDTPAPAPKAVETSDGGGVTKKQAAVVADDRASRGEPNVLPSLVLPVNEDHSESPSETGNEYPQRPTDLSVNAELRSAETHRAPGTPVQVMSERSLSTLTAFASQKPLNSRQAKSIEPGPGGRETGNAERNQSIPAVAWDTLKAQSAARQGLLATHGLENNPASNGAKHNSSQGKSGAELTVKSNDPSSDGGLGAPATFSAVSKQVYDQIASAVRVEEIVGQPAQEPRAPRANIVRNLDVVLHPPECGTVQLRMSMRTGEVDIEVNASNLETARAIGDDKPELHRKLGEMGMHLTHLAVNVVPDATGPGSEIGLQSGRSAAGNSQEHLRDAGSNRFEDTGQQRGSSFAQNERKKDTPANSGAALQRRVPQSNIGGKSLYV